MPQLKVEYISTSKIKPYAGNAKEHPSWQVDQIVQSIQEFGDCDPIGVWTDSDGEITVVEGHGRLMALNKLGIDTAPVIFLDHLTDEQRRAYALVHNQLTMNSDFDTDLLEIELDAIADIDMSDFGFDIDFDDVSLGDGREMVEEDEVPESAPSIVQKGDVWQLGRHRLMCGDSTNSSSVDMLMGGQKADMVMEDPPYGINAEKMTMGTGAKKFYRGEDWDSERPDISIAFKLADNVCIWGGNYFADVLPISNDWLVWHKKNDGLSFSECELAWTNFGRNVRHISHHWGNEKKLHVTMKPVQVIAWAIQQAKEKANVVVDLFGGSGSTLIACEQLSRTCYMMEIDPHYYDIIIERWQNLTGETAQKVE